MKKVLLVFLAVLLGVPIVYAAEYTVCPHLSCDYQTITACFNAINNTADNICNINESGTYTINGAYTYNFTSIIWGPTPSLIISANDTTLNCNGATFIGQDTYEEFRVGGGGAYIKNTIIKNCNFKHFEYPIHISNVNNPTVTNNHFEFCAKSSADIIKLSYVAGGRIENNTFLNNTFSGGIDGGYPIALDRSNDTIIKNNYMNGGRKGIILYEITQNIQIINNTIIGMSNEGVYCWHNDNANSTIANNTIKNCQRGIVLSNSSHKIIGNKIDNTSSYGIGVAGPNNIISGNVLSYNGVAIGIGAGNTLIDNLLNYNNNKQLYVPYNINVTIISLTIGSPVANYYLSKGDNTLNLSNSNSAIRWSSSTIALNGNFGLNLYLGDKFVSLNATALPDLNTKANVSINGVNCNNFKLWYASGFYSNSNDIKVNGAIVATNANINGDCTNTSICKHVQCLANTLKFEAQHFDSFGAEGEGATGNVSINLTGETSIMVKYNINYGSGRVDPDKSSAVLDSSLANATNGTWVFKPQYLYIENDGTVNVSVNITSSKTAASFIGGTNPEFKAKGKTTEANACAGTLQMSYFNVTNTSRSICSLLQFGNSFDTFNVSTRLLIPSDAPTGYKESVLTFTAKKV